MRSFRYVCNLVYLVGVFLLPGCAKTYVIRGELGCETTKELVARYEDAHKRKDIESLRALFFNNAQAATRVYVPDEENAILEILSHPLQRVEFVAGPGPDPDLAAEVLYYIPGANKKDGMIGILYGKLIISIENGRTVDPSFVVMNFQGRYYIDFITEVLVDAADALREGRKPKYAAATMEPLPDPRKGERRREFK